MRARAQGLRSGALFNAAPQITSAIIAIGMSPFIVAQVGLAAFGFWSVLQTILLYAQVADAGIPVISTRVIAGASGIGDARRVAEAFWGGVLAMSVLGTAVVSAAALAVALLPSDVFPHAPSGWQVVVLVASGALALLLISNALRSAVEGRHRWQVKAITTVFGQVAGALVTVSALVAGAGLLGLAIGALAPGLVGIVGYGLAARRLLGDGATPCLPSRALITEVRGQAANLQVVALVAATNAQADRLLLLPFAPLSFIGAYSLGARMAETLRALPVASLGPLIARGSETFAKDGLSGVRALYRTSLRALTAVGIAGALSLYGAMYPAILAWLGPTFQVSAIAAAVLGLGYSFNLITGSATALALSANRSDLDRDYLLVGLAVNLGLTFPLGFLFGPWGVVAATSAGLVVGSIWLLRRVDRWLDVSSVSILRGNPSVLPRLGVGMVIFVGAIGSAVALQPLPRLANLALSMAWVGCAAVPAIRQFRRPVAVAAS